MLPTNFFANNVLATLSLGDNDDAPALLCDNCEDAEQPVEKRCKDCLQFLCAPCVESHQRSRDTKNHVLQSKDELKNNEPAENARPLKCSKHHELIKFYCDTCQKTICMSCTVLEHKPHKVVSLEESASDAKEEVQNLIEKVEERVETISGGIDVAVAQSQDITAREEACKSQIEAFFAQLQTKIDAEKQKLLAMTASAAEYRKNQVQAPKKVMDLVLSMCQNGVNFAKHTLENGNDVQLLNIKPTITQYLVNLKSMEDEVTPKGKVGNPVRFLKTESPIHFCLQLIRDICTVDEVAVCPAKCEAKFLNPTLKLGKKSVIVITCKDKGGWIISSGCGKDLIQPTFTGVELQDTEISENQDGTHEISFVVNELGTLQFEAKINGLVAPTCSLEAEVKWELSDVHGSGNLRMNGQMVNCLSGEGDVGKYCFRLGDTPMTTGIVKYLKHSLYIASFETLGVGGNCHSCKNLPSCGRLKRQLKLIKMSAKINQSKSRILKLTATQLGTLDFRNTSLESRSLPCSRRRRRVFSRCRRPNIWSWCH